MPIALKIYFTLGLVLLTVATLIGISGLAGHALADSAIFCLVWVLAVAGLIGSFLAWAFFACVRAMPTRYRRLSILLLLCIPMIEYVCIYPGECLEMASSASSTPLQD